MSSDKIWNYFPGCVCLKYILIRFGYDNKASLMCVNDERLTKLEEFIQSDRSIVDELTCEHAEFYSSPTQFQFLPGHRAVLSDWCQNKINEVPDGMFTIENEAFSPTLREIIASALSNHTKPPNAHRFSKVLIDFSIYMYIMAGKACYETLCANLPLPKSGTVGKVFDLAHFLWFQL